jgi:hypothetical protein
MLATANSSTEPFRDIRGALAALKGSAISLNKLVVSIRMLFAMTSWIVKNEAKDEIQKTICIAILSIKVGLQELTRMSASLNGADSSTEDVPKPLAIPTMAERYIALRERHCAKVEAEQALAARELKRQRAMLERHCAKVEAEQALAARELKRQRAMLEDLKVKYTKTSIVSRLKKRIPGCGKNV